MTVMLMSIIDPFPASAKLNRRVSLASAIPNHGC